MKLKYLVIVSLILAIITIGAASASNVADDISISDDAADDAISADEEESEDGDEISVFVEEYDEDDKEPVIDTSDNSSQIAEIVNVPQGSEGNVSVFAGVDESEKLMEKSIKDLTSTPDEDGNFTYKVTLGDLTRTITESELFITVKFIGTDGNEIDSDEGTVKFANKSIEGTDVDPIDEPSTSGVIINLFDVDMDGESFINYLEDDYFATVIAPIDATGNITVFVNGKGYLFNKSLDKCTKYEDYEDSETIEYAIYAKELNPTLDVGNYTIKVSYIAGNYNATNETGTVQFDLRENHIIEIQEEFEMGYSDDIAYLDVEKLEGTVKVLIDNKEYKNNVMIEEDGYYVELSNINEAGVTVGNHTVKVIYTTANKTYEKEQIVKFTYDPKFDYRRYISPGEKDSVIISGPKGSTGVATLYTVNGDNKTEFKKVNVVDGSAVIELPSLTEGEHYFYINATINGVYADDDFEITVRNNTKGLSASVTPLEITVGENITVKFAGNKTTKGLIDVYIDNVLYKEDVKLVNGSFELAIPNLTVGSHDITVRCFGDYDYEDSEDIFYSNTFTVTVKEKQTPVTPVPSTNKVKLTLKKVKVKKSAKKLVIKAKLKINGKAVKGKKLKFKFNKKSYKAKTNKKGIAKIKIKKKVLKKLKVGKKVKYQVSYGKKTVKRTVKVKK